MTIATTDNRKVYTGNGSTTVFSFPYRFLADADIQVYLSGVLQTLTTHYTLTGAGGTSGGDVTFVTAPPDPAPSSSNVVIYRDPAIVQSTDWVENDPDPAAQKEDAVDLLTTICQRLDELIGRSFVLSDSDTSGIDLTLPTPIASRLLSINSDATALSLADFIDNVFVNQEAEPATDGSLYLWQQTSTGILYYLKLTTWTIIADGSSLLTLANTWTKTNSWAKGADVASANALTLGTDGNYFDITGTTAVTSITTKVIGTTIKLHFDGVLTLTHHATDLILPGGANITTAAGDEVEFIEYATGDWRCTSYTRASGAALVDVSTNNLIQTVNVEDGEVATTTTTLPDDDTIPQNTEGAEFMTLAVTPTDSANILEITVVLHAAASSSGRITAALFQDSTANALAASIVTEGFTNGLIIVTFKHRMVAGTTSSTTFKVRAGKDTAGTVTFNGAAGARLFGGVMASSITIKEITP